MKILFVISATFASADPCTRLCAFDGPSICTGGSWDKNGVCHGYMYRGDPARGDYCYHTAETAASCPSSGATHVKTADVAALLDRLIGNAQTTQRPPVTRLPTVSTTTHRPAAAVRPRPTRQADPLQYIYVTAFTSSVQLDWKLYRHFFARMAALSGFTTTRYSQYSEAARAIIEEEPNGVVRSMIDVKNLDRYSPSSNVIVSFEEWRNGGDTLDVKCKDLHGRQFASYEYSELGSIPRDGLAHRLCSMMLLAIAQIERRAMADGLI